MIVIETRSALFVTEMRCRKWGISFLVPKTVGSWQFAVGRKKEDSELRLNSIERLCPLNFQKKRGVEKNLPNEVWVLREQRRGGRGQGQGRWRWRCEKLGEFIFGSKIT